MTEIYLESSFAGSGFPQENRFKCRNKIFYYLPSQQRFVIPAKAGIHGIEGPNERQ
jgi:hypothetical protein